MHIYILPLLAFLQPVLAATLLVNIPPSALVPAPSSLSPATTASLTTLAHSFVAPLSASNTFSFRNVTAGSYLLDVHCPTYFFAPLRIDVGEDDAVEAWGTFRGNEWSNKGEVVAVRRQGTTNILDVKAVRPKNYYRERTGFSPLSILQNPMILLAGGSMIFVFGLPYLMDTMDPETRAEFEERQKSSPVGGLLGGGSSGSNPMANFDAAAWLAGAGRDTPAAERATGAVNR